MMKNIKFVLPLLFVFFMVNNITAYQFSLDDRLNEIPKDNAKKCIAVNKIANEAKNVFLEQRADGFYLYGNNEYSLIDKYANGSSFSKVQAKKNVLPNNEKVKGLFLTNYNLYVVSTTNNLYVKGLNSSKQIALNDIQIYDSFAKIHLLNNHKNIGSILFSYPNDSIPYYNLRVDLYEKVGDCQEKAPFAKYYWGYNLEYVEEDVDYNEVEKQQDITFYFQSASGKKYKINEIQYNHKTGATIRSIDALYDENISNESFTKVIEKRYTKGKIKYHNQFIYYSNCMDCYKGWTKSYYYYPNGRLKTYRYDKYETYEKYYGTKKINYFNDAKSTISSKELDWYHKKSGTLVKSYLYKYNKKLKKLVRSMYQTTSVKNNQPYVSVTKYYDKNGIIKSSYEIKDIDTSKNNKSLNGKPYIIDKKYHKGKLVLVKKYICYSSEGYYENYQKIEYKRNSKGELKSNKNGKAYRYITYYTNEGKAKKTIKWQYNAKGKLVNKKEVKIRK